MIGIRHLRRPTSSQKKTYELPTKTVDDLISQSLLRFELRFARRADARGVPNLNGDFVGLKVICSELRKEDKQLPFAGLAAISL